MIGNISCFSIWRGFILGLIISLFGCTEDDPSSAEESSAGESIIAEAGDVSQPTSQCSGETSAGSMLAGETSAGDASAGMMMAGENSGGMITAGEVTAGETTAGETTAGETTAGETTAGETTAGETTAGETTAGETTAGETPPVVEAVVQYDGIYFATFESEGFKSALAKVSVQQGMIEGEVINRYGEQVTLGGFIDADGVLRIPQLMGNMGSTFNAIGRVTRRGSIEGTFSVSGMVEREGTFAGSLDNQPIYRPSPAHDGLYQLSFIRGGQEVAVTALQIDQGRFSLTIVSSLGLRFEAQGFVSEDGTLALVGITPSEVLAEAYIDPDTKKIQGIYTIGRGENALVGDIQGAEAD